MSTQTSRPVRWSKTGPSPTSDLPAITTCGSGYFTRSPMGLSVLVPASQDAVRRESLGRAHATLDGDAHEGLRAGLLDGTCDDLLLDLGRDDEHAVDVPDDDVAGPDPHTADLDRDAEVAHDGPGARVLGVRPGAEDREPLPEHLDRVSVVALEHRSDGASRLR